MLGFLCRILGILDGLKLIQRRGHDKVMIQSNNLEVLKAIHGSALKTSNSALIRRMHCILFQEGQWIIRHIPREHNQSVDFLAKLAFSNKEDLQLIDTPPREAIKLLEANKERSLRTPRSFLM